MSNFSESMVNLLKNVDSVLSTKTVVGSPTKIEDTVIVPLVDVSFGIGAGSGGAGTYAPAAKSTLFRSLRSNSRLFPAFRCCR